MKNFVLDELLLLSHVEKRARRLTFDRNTTLIVGENDTGKSSLLKSIYATLGADPHVTHPAWRLANVISVIRFSLDGKRFTAARSGDSHYAIFDADDKVLGTFSRVTGELAPFLAELLDYRIKLPDREGKLITPPPAYLFLPFYVDQDSGWQRNWSSFARLQQLPGNWRKEIAEYHAGIRPNEYYLHRGELERLRHERGELATETQVLTNVRQRIQSDLPVAEFNLSFDDFQDELKALLAEAERVGLVEERYKATLVGLHTQRHVLDEQIGITLAALKELRADYEFAADKLGEHVDCPMCGATYDNNFAERFAIASDENRMNELLMQLQVDIKNLDGSIQDADERFGAARTEGVETQRLLATRNGEVTLQNVIASEGRHEVERVFKSNLDNYYMQIAELDRKVATTEAALKATVDRERERQIRDFYLTTMRRFLDNLDVRQIRELSFANIWTQVKETGSDLPRAMLAFYFSYLLTVRRFSSATFCPIVMDEPNQQGQDDENLPKMIQFILDEQPMGSQLILGLESLHGVEPKGKTIELGVKNRLLLTEEFESVSDIVAPLLNDSLAHAAVTAVTRRLLE